MLIEEFRLDKLYSSIKHYDHLPLLSKDIHEHSDTIYIKRALLMNSILGYGMIQNPTVVVNYNPPTEDIQGIYFTNSAAVVIDGDVSLIDHDEGRPIVSKKDIEDAGYESGVLCIVGWYQHIHANSVLRSWGGVANEDYIENDLLDNEYKLQVSTRYQFRWFPVLVDSDIINSPSISINFPARDVDGYIIEGSEYTITSYSKVDSVFVADKPEAMNYALTDLYIIPILKYQFSGEEIKTSSYLPTRPKGSSGFIESITHPEGEYPNGTVWYNPSTHEFKTYVADSELEDKFISSAATMGLVNLQSTYHIEDLDGVADGVPIGFDQGIIVTAEDTLQVNYEGLSLAEGEHYTVDYDAQKVSLVGFTPNLGDIITFHLIKVVQANDITNVSATFMQHMSSTASKDVEAHVKLSDSVDPSLGNGSGVAATPKAVYEATLIKDSSGKSYQFGVENGLLYIAEV